METPKGYRVYEEGDDYIKVGITDFSLIGTTAVSEIEYDGKIYKRGLLDAIPSNLTSSVCSMRIYNLVTKGNTMVEVTKKSITNVLDRDIAISINLKRQKALYYNAHTQTYMIHKDGSCMYTNKEVNGTIKVYNKL